MLYSITPILAAESPMDHVVDHPQIFLHNTAIVTNHMIMLALAAIIMLLVFPWLASVYRDGKQVATGTRNFVEAIVVFLRESVCRPVLGKETDRFMPFLWTMFFFILTNNILGLLPISSLTAFFWPKGTLPNGAERVPLGGTATADLYVTGALALVAFIMMQISGLRANGLANYLKHFLGGAPVYMAPIMILVEFVGMLVKPFALAIRLFANMSAGHILMAVLIGFVVSGFSALGTGGGTLLAIVVVLGSTAVMCLETFVAFLQAYIFTMLTCLFIGMLVVHEHQHGAGEHDAGEDISDANLQAGMHMAG
jgi:F-type H+-transporting ATPase subunit a